jgi:hypothetical protein
VDIAGGISQSAEDISDTFFGPLNGEWNGCTNNVQVSTGMRWIEGINQSWERWPQQWGSGQYFTDDISFITGSSGAMNYPFASVYDLDCISGWLSWLWGGSCPKDVVGTIYWENFPVTAHLAGGNPVVSYNYGTPYGWARWYLLGDAGVACSSPENSCESVVCADLHVFSTLECTWETYDPCANLSPDMVPPPECRLLIPNY